MRNITIPTATVYGLFIAFFLAPSILFLFPFICPADPLTNAYIILRESVIFLIAGMLILIIIRGEGKGLVSVGLHNRSWLKSLWLAVIILLVSFGLLLLCLKGFEYLGISYGDGTESKKYDNISLWAMTLVVLRAGIVEELFYRGYIIERLEKISRSRIVTILVPTLVFALFHYKQGIGGIIISFLIGLVMAIAYWKKRDLKANILAHFMIDFIPNVLVPLING